MTIPIRLSLPWMAFAAWVVVGTTGSSAHAQSATVDGARSLAAPFASPGDAGARSATAGPANTVDAIDPYVGAFFVTRPAGNGWLNGGELRTSVPFVELVPRVVGLTLNLEFGGMFGERYAAPPDVVSAMPPPFSAELRGAILLGVRARLYGLFSVGARAGYSALFSLVDVASFSIHTRHAGVLGFEVGFGNGALTVTGTADLLIAAGGEAMPVLGAGLCF